MERKQHLEAEIQNGCVAAIAVEPAFLADQRKRLATGFDEK